MYTFQKLISNLVKYWSSLGSCHIQSLDLEVGAGTFHPITFFNALKGDFSFYSYVQLCRRPLDSRYGNNFYRLQQYYQFQVIIKPTLCNMQDIYLNSLKYIGIDLSKCDIRFVEDNWENPSLGIYGVGWEVWLNGLEITQFTYFQNISGFNCEPVLGEITYGLERLCLYLQNVCSIYDLVWSKNIYGIVKYKDIFLNSEYEKSFYNLNKSDINFLMNCFINYESEALRLISYKKPLIISSYEFIVKMVHYFNLLDAKNYFSNIERQKYILRIRNLFHKVAKIYINL